MDKAGNVRTFQDPTEAGLASRACATPSAVQGLLDDKKCFIATAAFGSNMDPHVDLLRRFRARFLMPTVWGANFVKFYYNHSSIWAQKIRHSESARMIVRGFLWPVVGFAALSLDLGMPLALALVFFGISILSLVIIFRKKIKTKVFAKFSFFILFSLFSFSFFLPSMVKAQDSEASEMAAPANEDFEEGSAPNEPPYVDSATGDEFNEDFDTKATAPKIEEDRRSDSQATPSKNSQSHFSGDQASTVTGSFNSRECIPWVSRKV